MSFDKKVGIIEEIVTSTHNGKVKKTVMLRLDKHQVAPIQFQGRAIRKLEGYLKGHKVLITFSIIGKKSHYGVCYCNLVARDIRKEV